MQGPTCTGLRVRTVADAHVIFHAVTLKLLPMVTRRLDTEERRRISPGCVYVWEERGSGSEATGIGIERWTDSIRWGPSRVKDEFLYYHERDMDQPDPEQNSDSDSTLHSGPTRAGFYRQNLIKQTYSVLLESQGNRKKWHLIAYFTQESLGYLRTIDDIPVLYELHVPPGKYKSARSSKVRVSRQPLPNNFNSYTSSPLFLPPFSPGAEGMLAPLSYLENLPPSRRLPFDEELLMMFTVSD